MIDITLNLNSHCIETELKRLHSRALSEYFRANGEQKAALESTIDVLHRALAALDFARLRAAHRPLAGGIDIPIALRDHSGTIEIVVDGAVVFSSTCDVDDR